jgi:iron complex outermembrane recepter protein
MKTEKQQGTLPRVLRTVSLTAVTASFFFAGSGILVAGAQEAATARAPLEEIIVTATRRETSVQDVKYNLSAISGQQIDDLRILNTTDLARWIPGLTIVDQGSRQSNLAIIRGTNVNNVDTTDRNINTNGGTVGTFYGETPLYIDPLLVDMQRVEILRGPQGTLFGSRSLGGALRYIPETPDASEFSTDLHVRSFWLDESDDTSYQGDLTINAPIIKDVLAFRGSIARVENAGFIDYTSVLKEPGVSDPENPADLRTVEDANSEDVTLLRAALLWNITDSIDSTLTYTKQSRDVGGRQVNTQDSFGSGEYEAAYRYEEPNNRDHDIFQLDVNFDFGFATLTSATSFTEYKERGQRDQTDFNLFVFPPFADISGFDGFSVYSTETADTETFTQELRLVSQGESRLTWLAGIFYLDIDEKTTSTETAPGLSDYGNANEFPGFYDDTDVIYAFQGRNKLQETALFGQIGYQFTEAWQATIGGRWFDVENTLDGCTQFPIDFFDAGCEQGDASGDESIFMFNTSYQFTEAMLGYVTVSEGYGLGGSNPVPVCDDPAGNCIAESEAFVDPETVTNYELGMRTAWLNNTLTLNGAIYLMDYENIHVFGPSQVNPAIFITKSAGQAESTGIELELTAALGQFWWTAAGYTYNESELSQDSDGIYNETVKKGDLLPGTPRNQFSWYIANRFPMQNGLDFLFRYGINYTDEVYTKISNGSECCRENGEVLSNFFLHNASIGLAGEKWEATLFADNLTNENATTGVRGDTSIIQSLPDGTQDRRYYQNIIRPRSVGVDLRYRF